MNFKSWIMNYEIWIRECEMWNMKHEIWIKHEFWNMKCGIWNINHESLVKKYGLWIKLWILKYEMWNVKHELWSMRDEIMNYEVMNYEIMNYEIMKYELWKRGSEINHCPKPCFASQEEQNFLKQIVHLSSCQNSLWQKAARGVRFCFLGTRSTPSGSIAPIRTSSHYLAQPEWESCHSTPSCVVPDLPGFKLNFMSVPWRDHLGSLDTFIYLFILLRVASLTKSLIF